MLEKTDEKEKNQNCNNDKIYISRYKNVKRINNYAFFIRIDIKERNNMNQKIYITKNKQIVDETSIQQVYHA